MLNIVIPMAGRGQRFVDAGYVDPKPLIPIHGRPMIELVISNLTPSCPHRFIFIVRTEHVAEFELDRRLHGWAPGCSVLTADGLTEGAACTVLLARDEIDGPAPLMIANCDQYVDTDIDNYLAAMRGCDGLIMTMWADDPKWSFVRRDTDGRVTGVVEKEVVSNEATVGVYNFRCGADFVVAADAMIAANFRINGEFYVAPTYGWMLRKGALVCCHDVGSGMYGLGTPADLEAFLVSSVSRHAAAAVSEKKVIP